MREMEARRRRFKAAYKLEILKAADACTESGEVGAAGVASDLLET